MKESPILFTSADLFYEASLRFLKSGNPLLAIEVIRRGIEYNIAKKSGDAELIAHAYEHLPIDLQELKHNFLSRPTEQLRNGGHWSWFPWDN